MKIKGGTQTMKKMFLRGGAVLLGFVLLFGMVGCYIPGHVAGSGNPATKDFDLAGFTKLDIGGAFTAEITKSDNYSVSITVDDNLVDYLNVTRTGDTLYIGFKPYASFGFPFHVKANISMPELQAFTLSGASTASVTGFANDDMRFDITGASRADVKGIKTKNASIDLSGMSRLGGDLETTDADFNVSGASTLELTGSSKDIHVQGSGASSVRLAGFTTQNASMELSGASNAKINASGRLDVDISGASHLTYGDGPTLGTVKVSGASSLSRQ
jgi:hypothetical protein